MWCSKPQPPQAVVPNCLLLELLESDTFLAATKGAVFVDVARGFVHFNVHSRSALYRLSCTWPFK